MPAVHTGQVRVYFAQNPTDFESEKFFGLIHGIATTIQSESAQLQKYRDIAEKREKVCWGGRSTRWLMD